MPTRIELKGPSRRALTVKESAEEVQNILNGQKDPKAFVRLESQRGTEVVIRVADVAFVETVSEKAKK